MVTYRSRRIQTLVRLLRAHPGQLYSLASQRLSVTWLRVLRVLLIVRETLWEFTRNSGFSRSSGLAYASLLAIVPLVAAVSTIFAAFFEGFEDRIDLILNRAFPYQSSQITVYIHEFREKAQGLSGVALLVFLAVALLLFIEIDETVNRLWHAPVKRPFRAKLYSFTMLIFWGPLMLGLYSTVSYSLRRTSVVRGIVENTYLLHPLPVLVLFAALTMVYWLVPNTPVRLRNAALGAGVATVLFQGVRWGMAWYFANSPINVIYGAVTLILVVLVSLELTWILVLFGVSLTYTSQNFRAILREHHEEALGSRSHNLYYGLRAMVELASSWATEDRPPSVQRLANRMLATKPLVGALFGKLVERGFLEKLAGEQERYALARAPERIRMAGIVEALSEDLYSVPQEPRDGLGERLGELLEQVKLSPEGMMSDMTLAGFAKEALATRAVEDVANAELDGPEGPEAIDEQDLRPAGGR